MAKLLRRTSIAGVVALAALGSASSALASHSEGAGSWPMIEALGQTTLDFSGHGNDGTLGSGSTADSNDPSWILGVPFLGGRTVALRFRGDDYVRVADSPALEPARVSVSAWVRAGSPPGSFRYVVSKGALECLTASYGLYTGAAGGIAFYISNGFGHRLSPNAGPGVWDGKWHHVAGTYDGATVRLYVDGEQVGDGAPEDVALLYGLPDDDRFYIGNYAGPCTDSHGFVGDIDAVRVFGEALDPDQVDYLARPGL